MDQVGWLNGNPRTKETQTMALQCDVCGAMKNKMGLPWTEQGLRVHKQRVHPKGQPTELAPAPKKTHHKRPPVMVSFCPCCGTNLAVLQAALNVARKGV
jgi:hypothetical protein